MSRMLRVGSAIVLMSAAWATLGAGSVAAATAAPAMCAPSPDGCSTPVVTTRRVDVYASDRPAFVGWARVRSNSGWATACSIGTVCDPTSGRHPIPAWSWSDRQYRWNSTSIAHDTWVYASPYSGGWEWVWTQSTGWLAVRADRVHIKTITVSCYENGYNTCPQPM